MSTLYLWGKPILKETHPSNTEHYRSLSFSAPLKSISCGKCSCLVLTDQEVYAIGDNTEGQLGLGSLANTGLNPIKIELDFPYKIIEVSCGWHHSLLLDQAGNVFSSGRGDNGELGRNNVRNCSRFGFVLSGARQVSAGKDHSLALCGPKVFGWGNSKQGQLGLLNQKHYYRPQQLNVYPCSIVMAGNKFSLFVTSKGVFGCGMNCSYQLGLGHSNSIQLPRRLAIDEEIVQVSVGSYCAACTNQQQWYLWGNGILGLYKFPTKMTFLLGAESLCFGISSGIFVKKGQIWMWGNNDWGELGCGQTTYQYPVYSEQFSRLGLNNFDVGTNFLVAYSNSQQFHQAQEREIDSQNEVQKYPQPYFRRTNKGQNSSYGSHPKNRNLFDHYYNNCQNDPILQSQINRKLYSSQSFSVYDSSMGENISYATMQRTRPQTPKGWIEKKYVKLCNPTKTLQGSRSIELLQKENIQLKEKLQLQRQNKEKIELQYLRRVNRYDRDRLATKISKIQSLANSPKENCTPKTSNKWSSPHGKQPENISFRPRIVQVDEFQSMGAHISNLKCLLEGMAL